MSTQQHVKDQFNIVIAAINNGSINEAWDLVAQFEALFLHTHLDLCNELSSRASVVDPLFN